jgi:vacuolar iron transporter family protein
MRIMNGHGHRLHESHTPDAVRARLEAGPRHRYLRDFVYGAIDGAVTTFAIVCGVEGANLSSNIILILGLANLVGDGFSMAASNFLGTRTERELREQARREEELHIESIPAGEREEIRQIYAAKGFKGADLERAVEVLTSDKRQWVDTMLREELGLTLGGPDPWRAAASTFVAFVVIGAIPLLIFAAQALGLQDQISSQAAFAGSTVLTAVALFMVGAMKSTFVAQRWFVAGLQTLSIGGAAAALAYFVGFALRHLHVVG